MSTNANNAGLSAAGTAKYLRVAGLRLHSVEVIGSTNAAVRELAVSGEREGYVLLAGEQSSGRGRLGRAFYSPSGAGIYMSLLLRPPQDFPTVSVTTLAAVAVCEAIEAVSGEAASIKWVNDVFVRGRKVCGILTEGSLSPRGLEYAVLGIGVNVTMPEGGFPPAISGVAGAVLSAPVSDARNKLSAEILNRFCSFYRHYDAADCAARYRSRCFVLGRAVSVIRGGVSREALALSIDDECRLLVRYPDDSTELLSAGEISLRI